MSLPHWLRFWSLTGSSAQLPEVAHSCVGANSLDHYLLLDKPAPAQPSPWAAARLICPQNGHSLSVFSSEPGLQLYAGHGLTGGTYSRGNPAHPAGLIRQQ